MSENSKYKEQPRRGGHPGFGMPVQKAKNFKGSFRRLMSYLKPHIAMLIAVVIAAAFSSVFGIISPKIMGNITTELFKPMMARMMNLPPVSIDFDYILRIVIIIIVLYFISSLFSWVTQWIMVDVTQKTVYNLRKEIESKLSRLPLKYFDTKTHGEILSRATNDIDNISNTMQQSVVQILTSVVTLISIIIMMLSISPLLTLISFVILPVAFILTMFVMKNSQKYFKEQQEIIGNLNGHIEEMYTGHIIVKAFSREEKNVEKFNEINEKLYHVGWKAQFISGIMFPMMNFVSNLGYVAICVLGGSMVARGTISIGDIQAFIQYVRQFTHPIVQTSSIANVMQAAVASAERIFELLDEEEELPDPVNPVYVKNPMGNVVFENVSFGYTQDNILIKNMNINVKQGQTVAIVGPTGAGKTTLVNLLMHFYEVMGGVIKVDGVDITQMKRSSSRKMFGMVLQDTWLFSGTVKENLKFGRPDATDEEIIQAAKTAHAHHFICALEDGYDSVLNEDAANISQGQRQLLTITRVILANPNLLILDEATSSVDTRTEQRIQRGMKNLMKGRTSFVIAHRLSTIKDANLILVMNNGEIIETGTHAKLLEQAGFYADLYNSQFVKGGA